MVRYRSGSWRRVGKWRLESRLSNHKLKGSVNNKLNRNCVQYKTRTWSNCKLLSLLINDVNLSLLRTSFFAPVRKYNTARDATRLSIAKQLSLLIFREYLPLPCDFRLNLTRWSRVLRDTVIQRASPACSASFRPSQRVREASVRLAS